MLSVTIIAKNEEKNISNCILSVKHLANEILVVIDSTSTDKTEEICRFYGCKVFTRDFDNFSNQKNFAVSKSKNDWILAMDADETITTSLVEEIKKVLRDPKCMVYSIPRKNNIFGRQMKYTNWGHEDDRHVWLFNKHFAKWERTIHESVITKGLVGKLVNSKIHENYSTVEEFISQLNQYTTLESTHPALGHFPLWKFFRHYFLKLGVLDGWHGLFLSYLQAVSGLTVILKSWQRNSSSRLS